MEIVICQLTLDTLDATLKQTLADALPSAKVLVAKCIGCCGDCTNSYVVLVDGQPLLAKSREDLITRLSSM